MKEKELDKLLIKGEGITLDCKRAEGGLPGSLWEAIQLLPIPMEDTYRWASVRIMQKRAVQSVFSITGVGNADKVCQNLWNLVDNKEKVSVNLPHYEDVQIVNTDDRDVVVVKVPRADYNVRPVYINNNMMRGTFRRNHEGDYHCAGQMVRMMVRDAYEDGSDRLMYDGIRENNLFQLQRREHRLWLPSHPQCMG